MSAAVIVALAMLGAFVILCLVTLWKFSADEAIKVLGVFTGIFGLIFGAMGTYFFTRTELTAARAEATTAHNLATQYKAQLASVANTATQAKARLIETLDSKPLTYTVGELKADSGYKDVVKKLNTAADFVLYDGAMMSSQPPVPNDKNPRDMAEQKK